MGSVAGDEGDPGLSGVGAEGRAVAGSTAGDEGGLGFPGVEAEGRAAAGFAAGEGELRFSVGTRAGSDPR